MVNNVTGIAEPGNDIRQALNNKSQSGEYANMPFFAFLMDSLSVPENYTGSTAKNTLSNNLKLFRREIDSGEENADSRSLQDELAVVLSTINPNIAGLETSGSTADAASTGDSTLLSSAQVADMVKTIAAMLGNDSELKAELEDYLNGNEALPESIKELLQGIDTSEQADVLKEVSAKATAAAGSKTAVAEQAAVAAGTDTEQVTANASGEVKNTSGTEAAAKAQSATAGDYYTFEPRMRQISSNFSGVPLTPATAEQTVSDDNPLELLANMLTGRQSYNKGINDKAADGNNDAIAVVNAGETPESEDSTDSASSEATAKKSAIETANNSAEKTGAKILQSTQSLSKNESSTIADNGKNRQETENNTITATPGNTTSGSSDSAKETTIDSTGNARYVSGYGQAATTAKSSSDNQDSSRSRADAPAAADSAFSPAVSSYTEDGEGAMSGNLNSGSGNGAAAESTKGRQGTVVQNATEEFLAQVKQQTANTSVKDSSGTEETKTTQSLESYRIRLEEFPSATLKLVKNTQDNSISSAKLTLKPESLGTLTVNITMAENVAKLSITADSKEALKSVESQISVLKEKLSQEGIQTDKIELSYKDEGNYLDNFLQDNAGGQAQKEFDDARKEFISSFGYLNDEALAEGGSTDASDAASTTNTNFNYYEQGSSFVQYI